MLIVGELDMRESHFVLNMHNFALSVTYEELPSQQVSGRMWKGKTEQSD